MRKAPKFDFLKPVCRGDDEDETTLAAIDEDARDAKVGRTVSAEQIRKLLRLWITGSSLHKKR
jgi:hypothetical protein